MRADASIAAVALAGLLACDQPTNAPAGGSGLSLIIQASGLALDSGYILVRGPTPKTLKVVPPATVTIDGLQPGSYTVSLEGFANDVVDRFFPPTGVTVAKGQNASVTVTAAQFASFVPSQATVPSSAIGKSFTVNFQSVAGAMRYEAQAATEQSFATVKASGEATPPQTSVPITVPDYGTYYVRVRAIDPYQSTGHQSAGRWISASGSTLLTGPPAADQSTLSAAPTSISASSGASTATITVTARDAAGNPIQGATVVLAATGTGNTLTQPAGGTNASGVATGALSSTVGGIKTASATINGTLINQTANVTVLAGSWTAKTPMPTARSTPGVGVLNGVLYAAGGFNPSNSGYFATVEAYDASTNAWTTKAPMPAGRSYMGVAEVGGALYAVGGISTGPFVATSESYDPTTNVWTTRAPMPTPRYMLDVAAINGVLYAVGGQNTSGYLTTVEAYDPNTGIWTIKTPMPTARKNLSVAVVNGVLYAVGGENTSGYLATVEAYDPNTGAWTTKASMPTARSGLGVAAVNGVLYAVGGYNGVYLKTVEAYDPATNAWTTNYASMPTPRYGLGVGVINGVLYAVGGVGGSGQLATMDAFQP